MDRDTYFIADTHIGYGSRRTMSDRKFGADWQRHEEIVLNGINRVVNKKCTLYILGDVGSADDYDHLKRFLTHIKTRRIYLCLGNHDKEQNFQRLQQEHVIIGYDKIYELKYNKIHFVLCHYPIYEWNYFYDNGIHLYGHTHNSLSLGWRSMDVGIDNIGYTPISVTEVLSLMSNKRNVDDYRNRLRLDKR